MTKWLYLCDFTLNEDIDSRKQMVSSINSRGEEGWELVQIEESRIRPGWYTHYKKSVRY